MPATKWEYRIFHDLTAPDLNPLGLEGWEFVTVEFDDEGEILNAFAKRVLGGGQASNQGGGGGGGSRRRRRRSGGGGGNKGQGGGSGHPIGPMT